MSEIKRATGVLVIEVTNSNPNGDPDRENDPRINDLTDRGLISDKAIKRKLRDLVDDKRSPVWTEVSEELGLSEKDFGIFVYPGRPWGAAIEAANQEGFLERFWDVRVFGTTHLPKEEERKQGAKEHATTGPVHFGMGHSVAPIRISRLTNTNVAPVEEGKERAMAPMAHRIVPHGVYVMPFFVNPHIAGKTKCSKGDIDLLLHLLPHAFSLTRSSIRPQVEVRHAWYIEHRSILGSVRESELVEALSPARKGNAKEPSTSWKDYDVPTHLPAELESRVALVRDLAAG